MSDSARVTTEAHSLAEATELTQEPSLSDVEMKGRMLATLSENELGGSREIPLYRNLGRFDMMLNQNG